MNIIVNELSLIKRHIIMSYKNYIQFPVDFFMNFIMIFFDIATLLLFWYSITNLGIVVENWSKEDLLVFVSLNLFSEAVSKLTFGFRDLEYFVINGTLDKYLIRPVNVIQSILLEKLNIFSIVCKTLISILLLVGAKCIFDITLHHTVLSFSILIIGTLSFELLYGSFTLLTFWVGRIYKTRELIFSFKVARKYPIDIFPTAIKNCFTYIIPLAFLSTIPTNIILGKSDYKMYLFYACMLFLLVFMIFKNVLKRALNKYDSTGC